MDLKQLKTLFESQRELDQEIAQKHNVDYDDLWNELLMALIVEIGECANETRTFKFWSLKGPSEKNVILEEYVDGIHFLLSIGLHYGYVDLEELAPRTNSIAKTGLLEAYHAVFRNAVMLKEEKHGTYYNDLFEYYFALGHLLSFTDKEIIDAYNEKHKENYRRQENGY